jgi:hypothetical protein
VEAGISLKYYLKLMLQFIYFKLATMATTDYPNPYENTSYQSYQDPYAETQNNYNYNDYNQTYSETNSNEAYQSEESYGGYQDSYTGNNDNYGSDHSSRSGDQEERDR